MQDMAFRIHLVEFQAAGFRDAEAVPEHQEQQATVAGSLRLPLAAPISRSTSSPVRCLRSLSAPRQCSPFAPRFLVLRRFIILSKVPVSERPGNPYRPWGGKINFRQNEPFCRRLGTSGFCSSVLRPVETPWNLAFSCRKSCSLQVLITIKSFLHLKDIRYIVGGLEEPYK